MQRTPTIQEKWRQYHASYNKYSLKKLNTTQVNFHNDSSNLPNETDISSTSSSEYQTKKGEFTCRIKSRSNFNQEIDKDKRMEALTVNIQNTIRNLKFPKTKIQPKRGFKLTTSNGLFKQDMKWLKKANPFAFKNQERAERESRKLANNKRARRLIKEKLIMSGKSL
mmetsp:Transcript_18451/g.16321  ORF Transcript_18451/g.16321 Transcript_18451/m.16321 type:complete len:167 (+) Transcript_18451:444-944(+)